MREKDVPAAMARRAGCDGRDADVSSGERILSVRGVNKSFGSSSRRTQVLFSVDIDVTEGECLAVIGLSLIHI